MRFADWRLKGGRLPLVRAVLPCMLIASVHDVQILRTESISETFDILYLWSVVLH